METNPGEIDLGYAHLEELRKTLAEAQEQTTKLNKRLGTLVKFLVAAVLFNVLGALSHCTAMVVNHQPGEKCLKVQINPTPPDPLLERSIIPVAPALVRIVTTSSTARRMDGV